LVDNHCNLFSKLQHCVVTIPGCGLLYHALHADAVTSLYEGEECS